MTYPEPNDNSLPCASHSCKWITYVNSLILTTKSIISPVLQMKKLFKGHTASKIQLALGLNPDSLDRSYLIVMHALEIQYSKNKKMIADIHILICNYKVISPPLPT